MAPRKTFIVGVGMTACGYCARALGLKLTPPSTVAKPRNLIDYPELAVEAATKALLDAGINYDLVEQAHCGYVYGDSTCGRTFALGDYLNLAD